MVPRRTCVASALALFFVALTSFQGTAAADSPWSGEYVFAGGSAERASIATAIKRSTEEIGALIRGIIRRRLAHGTKPYPTVRFDDRGKLLAVTIPGLGTWTTRTEWTEARGIRGERVKVKHRRTSSALVQTIKSKHGTRTNTFQWTDEELVLAVRIESRHLPQPVEYALTYKRR